MAPPQLGEQPWRQPSSHLGYAPDRLIIAPANTSTTLVALGCFLPEPVTNTPLSNPQRTPLEGSGPSSSYCGDNHSSRSLAQLWIPFLPPGRGASCAPSSSNPPTRSAPSTGTSGITHVTAHGIRSLYSTSLSRTRVLPLVYNAPFAGELY